MWASSINHPGRGRPGTIYRIEWPDPEIEVLWPGSTHGLRPAEVLQLGAALGLLPARVVVFGIEVGNLDLALVTSPAMASAIPELARRIAAELKAALPDEFVPVAREEKGLTNQFPP